MPKNSSGSAGGVFRLGGFRREEDRQGYEGEARELRRAEAGLEPERGEYGGGGGLEAADERGALGADVFDAQEED